MFEMKPTSSIAKYFVLQVCHENFLFSIFDIFFFSVSIKINCILDSKGYFYILENGYGIKAIT